MKRTIILKGDRPVDGVMRSDGETVEVDEAQAVVLIQNGAALPSDGAEQAPVTRVPGKGSVR